MHKTLSFIGCGHLGKTLGRLWASARYFTIQDVLTASTASAQRAVRFIGAGRAVGAYADLRPADIYLIATPDDQLAAACAALAGTGCLSAQTVVFHCSGALPASVLLAAQQSGAAVAAIHPIRSFAAPEKIARNFGGTYCGVEGEQRALDLLSPAFSAIGAHFVAIDPAAKILYHSAAVFACNYLATLLDVAQQAYVQAGIAPDTALKLMEPLVRETVDNVFRLGPAAALSGPIARGDMATVERQQDALAAWDKTHGALYAQLAQSTIALAARRTKPRP